MGRNNWKEPVASLESDGVFVVVPGLAVASPDGAGGGGRRALLAGEALLILVLVLHRIHRTLGA